MMKKYYYNGIHYIYYTGTSQVTPNDTSVFGATYIGSEWDSDTGDGKLIFSGCPTQIGDSAFFSCADLISVNIPNTITSLGDLAFAECSNIVNFLIPNTITNVGYDVFGNCSNISDPIYNNTFFIYLPEYYSAAYTIPSEVSIIAGGACFANSTLTDIIIPDNVTVIKENAFSACDYLQNATIGIGITDIESKIFYNCNRLYRITYTGTMSQWNLINKASDWGDGVSATVVHCTDGDVAI